MSSDPNSLAARGRWLEIVTSFLKIGSLAYGGPAIMGLMQTEFQEKRQWLNKERFLEGLALVNTLPGAGATQLGIFLGHARGGYWGGLLAGLCFVLPAFFIMLVLVFGYAKFGNTPLLRGALYGLGPVVLGIFAVAVFRLGRHAVTGLVPILIALAAAVALGMKLIGVGMLLATAGGLGLALFYSRRLGGIVILLCIGQSLLLNFFAAPMPIAAATASVARADLLDIGVFFFKVGALTFGGGLSMIAFVQEQVVNQFHWLTAREFIDGLALGQFTPGPILMVAAYVGYKMAGLAGAAIAAAAIFLPSFILMLSILPIFDRMRQFTWMQAALKGVTPAVIGVLVVVLVQMAPHAVTDVFAGIIFGATVLALFVWRLSSVKIMLGGALAGILHGRIA